MSQENMVVSRKEQAVSGQLSAFNVVAGKYQPYPEYKESGVEWIKLMPESWTTVRLDGITKYIRDTKAPSWLEGKSLVHYSIPSVQEFGVGQIEDGEELDSNKLLVEEGDLLVSKLNPRKSTICAVQSHDRTVVASTEFVALRSNSADSRYLAYLFLSKELSGFICSQVESATRSHQRVHPTTIYKLKTPLPKQEDRCTIAAFLDHETARIDALISKQHRLIELLKEKRQAVISHAVTKGLNPNAPMKDSGVEWLGQVPAHWEVMKFTHCARIRNGQVDPKLEPYVDYYLIAPNHIESKEGKIVNLETAQEQGADSGKYLCKKGEVIYSKIRPALVKACLSPSDKVLCSADMYPVQGTNGLTNGFLLWYFLSDGFTRFAVNQADRVAMPKINRESLAEAKVPVPPSEEQYEICSYINEKTTKLDTLVSQAEVAKQLLQERRTALISAAVTGKIDVRNWSNEKA